MIMNTDIKRAYCLYRVSTIGQVEKDDIPMQKQDCREFALKQGWEVTKEFSEKGISGFKISAKDRDAIQEIQKDATLGKFDILLVFMFDRLGRREDETPFVVEWFVRNGIEVWSVHEGQQRFDNHVDKLMNYIRYWQASGESIKTSIRTKTRLGQIVQEGKFRGGTAPYGYRLEKKGRLNNKNAEVNEILINEEEARIVKKIFELYVNAGYGSQRMCTYLSQNNIQSRTGNNFINTTIQGMLKNVMYTGILRSGETKSEIFPNLQIIEPDIFNRTQEIIAQRSSKHKERTIPLNTKGKALLSGNVFCGHCGGRLILTTNGKKYVRKSDGEVTITPRIRYICYNKSRHPHLCDGQTGYTARKLDEMIEILIKRLFAKINDFPKEEMIDARLKGQMEECKSKLVKARIVVKEHEAEMKEYEAETLKVIRGNSNLNADLLNKLYSEAKGKVERDRQHIVELEEELDSSKQKIEELTRQYETLTSWADMYDGCDLEARKMIVNQIMKKVKVYRDYELEIDFSLSCEQLGIAF